MAITAQLVESSPNRLRYLLTYASGLATMNITSTGAATPDLLTDSKQGPLKKLAKVIADGFAGFAAGAQTQAKARALWLSDWSGANPAPGAPAGGPPGVTTAIARIAADRTGAIPWRVDADVDTGNPVLTITCTGIAGGQTAYLDVFVPEAIG